MLFFFSNLWFDEALMVAYSVSESDSSSDDEVEFSSNVLAAMCYSAASSFQYFLQGKYHPDIDGRKFCYSIPE